ncbi:hypothetical protein GJ744_006743 [Endocarpon pusillum]|uniref:Apple domain-containing protein n=1 Tax=Endocarpon pusillum TaxID=364733 RepID=A0A8H7ALP3_9EURO|nr:hypothetical protein GJ744_006743 [Endocarpon pusillum]
MPTGTGRTSSRTSVNSTSQYYPTGSSYSSSVEPTKSANTTKSEISSSRSSLETSSSASATSSHTSSATSSTESSSTSSAATSESSSITSSIESSSTASATSSETSSASGTSSTISSSTSASSSSTTSATSSESSSTSSATSSSASSSPTECVPKATVVPNPPSGSTCGKQGGTSATGIADSFTSDASSCALACHDKSGCVAFSYDTSNTDLPLCRLYATSVSSGINDYGSYTFYDSSCFQVVEDCQSPKKRSVGLSVKETRRIMKA